MKHKLLRLLTLILTVIILSSGSNINAYANNSTFDVFNEYRDQFKKIFSDADEETISETFDFLQEKAADGSLHSDAGIEEAIREGKDRFDIEISDQHIHSMLELVTNLEDMGFNSEKIIKKARSMYDEYGIDFLDHTEELIFDAVKSSIGSLISNAISGFFRMVGDFFRDLFNGIF